MNRTQHSASLLKAKTCDLQGLRGQCRFIQQCFVAAYLVQPISTMLSGDREVLAARAGGRFAPHGIGSRGIAEARAVFLPEHPATPSAHAESQAGIDQHPRVVLDVFLYPRTTKSRPLSENLCRTALDEE